MLSGPSGRPRGLRFRERGLVGALPGPKSSSMLLYALAIPIDPHRRERVVLRVLVRLRLVAGGAGRVDERLGVGRDILVDRLAVDLAAAELLGLEADRERLLRVGERPFELPRVDVLAELRLLGTAELPQPAGRDRTLRQRAGRARLRRQIARPEVLLAIARRHRRRLPVDSLRVGVGVGVGGGGDGDGDGGVFVGAGTVVEVRLPRGPGRAERVGERAVLGRIEAANDVLVVRPLKVLGQREPGLERGLQRSWVLVVRLREQLGEAAVVLHVARRVREVRAQGRALLELVGLVGGGASRTRRMCSSAQFAIVVASSGMLMASSSTTSVRWAGSSIVCCRVGAQRVRDSVAAAAVRRERELPVRLRRQELLRHHLVEDLVDVLPVREGAEVAEADALGEDHDRLRSAGVGLRRRGHLRLDLVEVDVTDIVRLLLLSPACERLVVLVAVPVQVKHHAHVERLRPGGGCSSASSAGARSRGPWPTPSSSRARRSRSPSCPGRRASPGRAARPSAPRRTPAGSRS